MGRILGDDAAAVPPRQAKLTSSCPQPVATNAVAMISGKLTPGSAGDTVELTFTSPDGRSDSVTKTTTTDANGDWTHSFDTGPANDGQGGSNGGTWTLSAHQGTGDRQASGPMECTFEEQEDQPARGPTAPSSFPHESTSAGGLEHRCRQTAEPGGGSPSAR